MKLSKKRFLLDLIGTLFLLIAIAAIANSMYFQRPTQILYMCYIGLTLIGVGILMRRSSIILSQVYILAIPLFVWSIDFWYLLLTKNTLFGISNYVLEGGWDMGKIISLQHLFSVPLAIYAAKLIGIKYYRAWKWSFAQLTITYLLVTTFSDPTLNINCVFDPCINLVLGLPYRLTWFIILFSMTAIATLLINLYLKKDTATKKEKKKQKTSSPIKVS